MERIKVGTVIRKDLFEELKAAAARSSMPLSDLMEEGIILMLRREAVRQFQKVARGRVHAGGTAERILKESRRDLQERGQRLAAPEKRRRKARNHR